MYSVGISELCGNKCTLWEYVYSVGLGVFCGDKCTLWE